jgi:NAD(P)-dependent dehydrogenase (short-subunit alcohol dehydrogenase family)
MRLSNTMAIVTGSARGIGRGIALAFARAGADIALADRDATALDGVGAEIRDLGRDVLIVPADVTREDQVGSLVGQSLSRFNRIDVLVNNVGTIVMPGAILETTLDAWETMMAANARSAFLCTKAVLPSMIARRQGKIINISSVAGLRALPNRAAYCASKHAVTGLTKCVALDMKPYGIAVNAICPGAVHTPLTDYSRPDADKTSWMRPEDIADIAVFLASREARGMTGAVVEVSGWAE